MFDGEVVWVVGETLGILVWYPDGEIDGLTDGSDVVSGDRVGCVVGSLVGSPVYLI